MTNIIHQVSADGTRLRSSRVDETGRTLSIEVEPRGGVTEASKAEAARQLNGRNMAAMEDNTRNRAWLRHLGRLDVLGYLSTGGKPWLLPRPRVRVKEGWLEVGFGWLWATGSLGFKVRPRA